MPDSQTHWQSNRRAVLGAGASAVTVALAGCAGADDDGDDEDEPSDESPPTQTEEDMSEEDQTESADGELLVVLNTDDVWTNQMALNFTGNVVDSGYAASLFFNVRAVTVVNTAVPQHDPAMADEPMETLEELMDQGVTVYVCPSCTNQAGLCEAGWIEGAQAGGEELIDTMMSPNTKVVTY